MHYKLTSFVLVLIGLLLVSCDSQEVLPTLQTIDQTVETEEATEVSEVIETDDPAETPKVVETDDPAETPKVVETDDPAETPEVMETDDPAETPEVMETDDPAETPEVMETDDPMATPEVVDVENPLPSNGDGYYVAPAYATIEENLNVDDAPAGYYWVMATVTLGNQSGEVITVDMADIRLIGDDGQRYEPGELVERVSPRLLGTELDQEESIYGFALFALPEEVEPKLFEWCVGGNCTTPLQAPISLQED